MHDVTVDKSKDHPAFVEMEWPVPDPPIEGEVTRKELLEWANRMVAEDNPTRQRVNIVGLDVRLSKPGEGPWNGYDVNS